MNSFLEGVRRPFRHLGRRFWLHFGVACLIVWLLELGVDHLLESEDCSLVTQPVFTLGGLYQRIVMAPSPNLIPRYTVIVEINPKKDPTVASLTDICDQREMTSRLLDQIGAALPSVIVLDKYYLPHKPRPCPQDGELISAIENLRNRNIPVIIGRRISDESVGSGSAAKEYLLPSIVPDDANPCKLGAVNMDLASPRVPCEEGVINSNIDTRKLPLEFALFGSEDEAKKGQNEDWYETLSLRAARAYDSKLMSRHPRLAGFVKKGRHPYISFLRMDDFEPLQTDEVLHGGSPDRSSKDPISTTVRRMSGKIVLIGEINWDLDAAKRS